jgi:uncharacterized PurR-regulated membrane protein YhhQ (DUF165 family)
MKTGGWIVLITTWGIVLYMFIFSFTKILKEHEQNREDE